jgi:hypothetical protein
VLTCQKILVRRIIFSDQQCTEIEEVADGNRILQSSVDVFCEKHLHALISRAHLHICETSHASQSKVVEQMTQINFNLCIYVH